MATYSEELRATWLSIAMTSLKRVMGLSADTSDAKKGSAWKRRQTNIVDALTYNSGEKEGFVPNLVVPTSFIVTYCFTLLFVTYFANCVTKISSLSTNREIRPKTERKKKDYSLKFGYQRSLSLKIGSRIQSTWQRALANESKHSVYSTNQVQNQNQLGLGLRAFSRS